MTDTSDLNKLYMPFTENELKGDDTNLEQEDMPTASFVNKGNPLITILLFTTAVMICLTIYIGFFYELGFKKAKISKTSDLISDGETAVQAEIIRTAEADILKQKMTKDLEVAGYAIGGLAIVAALIFFGMIWYWRGVAKPDLIRENIIGRDLAMAMKTKDSLNNVAKLLAYHVHPDNTDARDNLEARLTTNLKNSMEQEIMFPSAVARRLRGAPPTS